MPVSIGGETYAVLPEEVEVRLEARSGLVVSQEGPYLAALHTLLTPELEKEGLAREFVRRVQEFRKQAGFEIADRIHMHLETSPRLSQAVQVHRDYVMAETLTLTMQAGDVPQDELLETLEFDGEQARLAIRKA